MRKLTRIYIQTSDGNTVFIGPSRAEDTQPSLGTSLVVRAKDTSAAVIPECNMTVAVDRESYNPRFDSRTLRISSPYVNRIWQEAVSYIITGYGSIDSKSEIIKYVSAINNVSPGNPAGNFFILGGMCVTPFISPNTSNIPDEDASGVMPRPVTNVLSLTDSCMTCQTCEKLLQVKERLEALKRVFWALKDINLYGRNTLDTRSNFSASAMMTTPAGCVGLPSEERLKLFDMRMFNVLGQYMTMVHMWNYVVGLGSHHVEFIPPTDDVSAFAVRVSFPKSACESDPAVTTACTITIRPYAVQDDLAAWIPEPELEFSPMQEYSPNLVGSGTQSGLVYTFSFSDDSALVGTYSILLRYYPFIPVIAKRLADPGEDALDPEQYDPMDFTKRAIRLDNGAYEVEYYGSRFEVKVGNDDDTGDDDNDDPGGGEGDAAPSVDSYMASKRWPRYSTADKNMWEIEITWGIAKSARDPLNPGSCPVPAIDPPDPAPEQNIDLAYTEVYYYSTPAVGKPMNNNTRDLKFYTPTIGRDPYMEVYTPEDTGDDADASTEG